MTPGEENTPGWPVTLTGVTESIIATRQPGGTWNVAALGLHEGESVTAKTWGRTRTRRNLAREGRGYVQFVTDPVLFTEAALGIVERDEPTLPEAWAWVTIRGDQVERGTSEGTEWVEWTLSPEEFEIVAEVVPTTNRGYNAVIEATVAASRLGVPGYDTDELIHRLTYFEDVARRCGGEREQAAIDRLHSLVKHPAVVEQGWDG